MKKILYFLSAFVLTLSMQSCFQEDNEVFDKPTAERIEEAAQETKTLLESSPNGWLLEYYTGREYSGGGYNMLMRFTDDKVYVSSDIAPADSVSHSNYDIKKDEGVVISVDTYNEIFHRLSNPSSSAIEGEEADYEFVVLRQTQDSIFVRGKKFGNKMVLTRLPESTNWKDYISNVQTTLSRIRRRYKAPDGTLINFTVANHHVYFGDDQIGIAFFPTADGLKLAEPYTLGADSMKVDFINVTKNGLGTNDLTNWTNVKIPIYDTFVSGLWSFKGDAQNMSSAVLSTFQEAITEAGEKPTLFALGDIGDNLWGFYFESGNSAGLLQYTASKVNDNTAKVTATGYVYGDGLAYYRKGYDKILNLLNANWVLSTDDTDNPSYIRFTSASNANLYFVLYPTLVSYPFGE